jgi:hypothetical protein
MNERQRSARSGCQSQINVADAYGTDFSGCAEHIEIYAGYRHGAGTLAASRDFSACNVRTRRYN